MLGQQPLSAGLAPEDCRHPQCEAAGGWNEIEEAVPFPQRSLWKVPHSMGT